MGGDALAGLHKLTILSGASPDVSNDIESPDRVTPYETEAVFEHGEIKLSPHSVTVIQTLKK